MRELSEKNKHVRERAAKKREATSIILKFILENKDDLPEEIIEAADVLTPKHGGGGGGIKADSKKSLFITMLEDKGTVHEDDVFLELKLGRTEVRNIRNDLIKTVPENRVWVAFDRDTGNYTVAGKGAEMPANWDGYVPEELKGSSDQEIEDIEDDLLAD